MRFPANGSEPIYSTLVHDDIGKLSGNDRHNLKSGGQDHNH